MTKTLFLLRDLDAPSSRYRVLQYLPYFQRAGIETIATVSPGGPNTWRRLLPAIKAADLLFVQRKRLPLPVLLLLKRLKKRLIYDFDDAVMYRNASSGDPHSVARRLAFRSMMRFADVVIAGNSFLKGEAEKYRTDVRVLPTPIDAERYPEKTYAVKTGVDIGWIGSASTIHYLERRKDIWDGLGEKYEHVSLAIICDRFFKTSQIPVKYLRWSSEHEVEYLQALDIGLMPLTDDLWSRGKCGFKLIQYMAAGIPAVCSPVGVNREIVDNGVTGLWADSVDDWIQSLSRLIQDSSLRRTMGAAGRRKALERYTVQVCAPTLIEWVRGKAE